MSGRNRRRGGRLEALTSRLRLWRRKGGARARKQRLVVDDAPAAAVDAVLQRTRGNRPRTARGNKRRENPLLLLLAWLLPAAVAVVAFTTPFLGARAYEYLMHSGHFFVREVVVVGHDHLDADTLREVAGIRAGTHVLAADLDGMARRLEAHPWIAQATVTRELPDRLLVSVVEHHPVAYLAADRLWLVGSDGRPFAEVGPRETEDLPILTGLPREAFEDPREGAVVRADARAAVNVVRLYEAMGLGNRWPVAEVRLEPGRRITLVLSGSGTEAVLGAGPYRQKLYRLEWVLEKLHQEGKVADYLLLDGAGPSFAGRDDGRVVVRADLAPTDDELADVASERARRAAAGLLPGAAADGEVPDPGGDGDEAGGGDEALLVTERPAAGASRGVRPAIAPAWLDEGGREGAGDGTHQQDGAPGNGDTGSE